ncbi:MAG: sulfite exporter TauE/SafE family protein [Gammaproteobacteria bacterium]|nr:sulfite exporter TauE/SafE family protein [Gammaproteobacteria bacterium]
MFVPDHVSLATLALFTAIIFASGLVHGTLGLGFPVVATPLLALFLDVRTAILITLLPTATVNIASVLRGGHWRESLGKFWPLAAYAVIGSALGTWLIIVSDPSPFKLVLALLIFLYLGSGWLGTLKISWAKTHRRSSMLVFGLMAGVAAGTTNVMVPILIIYTLELGLATTAMVQVFNMCFLAGKLMQIATFAGAGVLGPEFLLSTVPLAGVALAALFLGMALRDRISTDNYRVIIRGVLFVVALILIGQFILGR